MKIFNPEISQVLSESDDAPVGCKVDVVNENLSVYLQLQGNINVEAELQKLKKKMEEIEKWVDSIVHRKKIVPSYFYPFP